MKSYFGTMKNLLPDACIGGLLGFFVLHPIAMVLTGSLFEHSGSAFDLILHPLTDIMGIYFTLLGLCVGLLSGYFRNALKVQNMQLKETVSQRNTLLRVLSHDLANSVGGASSYVELLSVREPSWGNSREFRCIASSLRQAVILMETTRSLLSLETGKLRILSEEHDIVQLAKETLMIFEYKCESKNLTVELKTAGDERFPARIDPVIFKNSVIGNLLSNAVKFSPSGGRIEVVIFRESPDVLLSVINSGPQIPAVKAKSIFQESRNVSTPGVSGERGAGFGLPLVYKFVKLMGGDVRVESTATDKPDLFQNTFTLRIPAA